MIRRIWEIVPLLRQTSVERRLWIAYAIVSAIGLIAIQISLYLADESVIFMVLFAIVFPFGMWGLAIGLLGVTWLASVIFRQVRRLGRVVGRSTEVSQSMNRESN